MEESRIDASMTGRRFPGPYGESSTDIKHQLIRDPLKKVREVQTALGTLDCEGGVGVGGHRHNSTPRESS